MKSKVCAIAIAHVGKKLGSIGNGGGWKEKFSFACGSLKI